MGDSHNSKTANIILPGLMNKGERPYICKRHDNQIHSTALCWLKQLISPKLNTIFRLQTISRSQHFSILNISQMTWD